MTGQREIRRRLKTLESQQERRIAAVEEAKKMMDNVVAEKQREIVNLRAQITIQPVP